MDTSQRRSPGLRAVDEGELAASTDISGGASFYATVMHGLAVRAGDGASRKALYRLLASRYGTSE